MKKKQEEKNYKYMIHCVYTDEIYINNKDNTDFYITTNEKFDVISSAEELKRIFDKIVDTNEKIMESPYSLNTFNLIEMIIDGKVIERYCYD